MYFKTLNLFPNSIASGFGVPYVGASAAKENTAYIYDTDEKNGLPTWLSSITLRNIQHRYSYDNFDFAITSFGSLVFNSIDNVVTWTPISNPASFDP